MSEWTSKEQGANPDQVPPPMRFTNDGRLLVLDNRGFWIAVNINKSVPSWRMEPEPGAPNV